MALNTGTYISGFGHAALILWALVGGFFLRADDPLPLQSTEVSLLTGEEFAALTQPTESPSVASNEPDVTQPEEQDDLPVAPSAEDRPPEAVEPDAVAAPETETTPDTPELETLPQADVSDDAPQTPEPPSEDVAALVPAPPDETPTPAPAPRIAPTPAPEVAPDTEISDTVTPEVVPDEAAETPAEEKPATAPQEAADQIVTEAEKPSSAPTASVRPKSKPKRPVVAEAPKPATPTNDAIADAVAAAVADSAQTPAVPSGPPLSRGEKDALRVAVSNCWNTGSLSSEALQTTVVVAVSLARDGKPDIGSIRMLSFDGGSEAAAQRAYDAARRAIVRCGASGFNLPSDKYSHWQNIEMTFNPERMRIK